MNTEHLKYILTIAQYQSINQAAEALHLQRPYLSKVLGGLEKQLAITIFERVPKGLVVTTEGQYALGRIQAVVDILDELACHFQSSDSHSFLQYHDQLRLFSPARMRSRSQIGQIIEQFQQRFPNVAIALPDQKGSTVPAKLTGSDTSLALVVHHPQIQMMDWPLSEQLTFIPLRQQPLTALAGANNPLAQKYKSISLNTLRKQELILMDRDGDDQAIFYDLLAAGGKPNIKHVISGNMPLFYHLLKTKPYFSLGLHSSSSDDDLLQIPLRENICVTVGLLFDPLVLANVPAKALLNTVLIHFGQEPYP